MEGFPPQSPRRGSESSLVDRPAPCCARNGLERGRWTCPTSPRSSPPTWRRRVRARGFANAGAGANAPPTGRTRCGDDVQHDARRGSHVRHGATGLPAFPRLDFATRQGVARRPGAGREALAGCEPGMPVWSSPNGSPAVATRIGASPWDAMHTRWCWRLAARTGILLACRASPSLSPSPFFCNSLQARRRTPATPTRRSSRRPSVCTTPSGRVPPVVDPGPAAGSSQAGAGGRHRAVRRQRPVDAWTRGGDGRRWNGRRHPRWRDGGQPPPATSAPSQSFGDCQLHVEWMARRPVKGHSQGRGNSGVFLLGRYEIQVLDSYQNPTYADGQAASIYGQRPPLVNACRPPGEWQIYDIVFIAPRFDGDDTLVARRLRDGPPQRHPRARTRAPSGADRAQDGGELLAARRKGPIQLQDHGNPVHDAREQDRAVVRQGLVGVVAHRVADDDRRRTRLVPHRQVGLRGGRRRVDEVARVEAQAGERVMPVICVPTPPETSKKFSAVPSSRTATTSPLAIGWPSP